MSDFDPARFARFCSFLKIDSKEQGLVPLKFMGTQQYLIDEMTQGLKEDVHTFVVLKGRQAGISTASLALDLYWLFKHPGLQGLLVTDTDENREVFRSNLTMYVDSLPGNLKPSIMGHNRTQLLLGNRSRLVYLVAGTKKSGNLGRGKAANYLHATEMSSWGDEEGYASLLDTLAQNNPNRMYLFESTARGYDMFYRQWENAKASKSERAIFIGWWRNENNRKERGSQDFKTYWDGAPTSDELVWIKEIFERYKWKVTPEQIAWWRHYLNEKKMGDEMLALQENPPTEDYAFQLSGSKYFSGERVNLRMQMALKENRERPPKFYRYKFGLNFEDTEFLETTEEMADVTVWEDPDPKGVYVIGADPAYGAAGDGDGDEFAAQGLRCFGDRVVQVFELGTLEFANEAQYAWAIAHLAGSYSPAGGTAAMLCLEMQGPGGAVFNELNNLKRQAGGMRRGLSDEANRLFDVVARMRDYLWSRQDSLVGAFSYQWQTNAKTKERMFSALRSYFDREKVDVRSVACVQQFRNVRRDGTKIGGDGAASDDRVVALAIAVICWEDWIMKPMLADNRVYAQEMRAPEIPRETHAAERAVLKFLGKQGIQFTPPSR